MHHHYVGDLILGVVETAFGVIAKVLWLRHLVTVWAEDEMDIGKLKDNGLRE